MPGLRRATLLVLAALLGSPATAAGATAAEHPPPWASGPDVDSALEAAAAAAVSEAITHRSVRIRCHSAEEWAAVSSPLGWDPTRVAGFAWIGGSVAELSPPTCLDLDSFWNEGAAEKRCLGTFNVFAPAPVDVRRKVRVRLPDGRSRVSVVKILRDGLEERRAREHRLVRCAEFPQRTHAVNTLAHEAFHLVGVRDEAIADCYAMQTIERVAVELGADPAFAVEMAAWMWSWYERYQETKPPEYVTPDCREDGPLDRSPGDGRWP